MKRTLLIQDLHIPWEHPDALKFSCAVREKYKLDQAISVGDEMDWHSASMHDHDPNLPSPNDELEMALPKLAKWHAAFPKLRLAKSNHGELLSRRMFRYGIPETTMRALSEIYQTPGWTWHEEIIEDMGGVPLIVRHAFSGNIKSALSKVGDCCVAYGHYHTLFGVIYRANLMYRQWAMCAGCLIDPGHRAFNYAKTTLDRPMLGVGVVIDGQAIPVPMWTRTDGRWTGKLS